MRPLADAGPDCDPMFAGTCRPSPGNDSKAECESRCRSFRVSELTTRCLDSVLRTERKMGVNCHQRMTELPQDNRRSSAPFKSFLRWVISPGRPRRGNPKRPTATATVHQRKIERKSAGHTPYGPPLPGFQVIY